MAKTSLWFDLDGCLVDLYGVENWLNYLRNFDDTPYRIAEPMLRMNVLARQLNALRRKGFTIGIISWCSKESTAEFDARIVEAKCEWLRNHLPSVEWDEIRIVEYGTPKWQVCRNGILFDDEERNRREWDKHAGTAFEPKFITEILSQLNKEEM